MYSKYFLSDNNTCRLKRILHNPNPNPRTFALKTTAHRLDRCAFPSSYEYIRSLFSAYLLLLPIGSPMDATLLPLHRLNVSFNFLKFWPRRPLGGGGSNECSTQKYFRVLWFRTCVSCFRPPYMTKGTVVATECPERISNIHEYHP